MEKHLQIIPRKIAKERGLKRYFTGKPCKHGHIAERSTANGVCIECAVSMRDPYDPSKRREKYLRSKEAVLSQSKNYYEKNREAVLERHKKRYKAQHKSILARRRRWAKENRHKVNEMARRHKERRRDHYIEKQRKYRSANREEYNLYQRKWRANNSERVRATVANRKSAQGHHTADDIKRLLIEQRRHCAACNADLNKTGYHVDHIQPLARGGTNWPDNLQILCPHCNLSKGAKDPVEWAQSRGKLL